MLEHVLVICSDTGRRSWFEAVLRREGHDAFMAASGREGLRHAYARRPALVVLDEAVSAPGPWETLDRLRENPFLPILMVLPGERPEETHALLGGADDVLMGKTDATRLVARVRALLRRRTSA
jgi:two-component system, OmpR family, copper resistance phosphate regulon response regulator CusR